MLELFRSLTLSLRVYICIKSNPSNRVYDVIMCSKHPLNANTTKCFGLDMKSHLQKIGPDKSSVLQKV